MPEELVIIIALIVIAILISGVGYLKNFLGKTFLNFAIITGMLIAMFYYEDGKYNPKDFIDSFLNKINSSENDSNQDTKSEEKVKNKVWNQKQKEKENQPENVSKIQDTEEKQTEPDNLQSSKTNIRDAIYQAAKPFKKGFYPADKSGDSKNGYSQISLIKHLYKQSGFAGNLPNNIDKLYSKSTSTSEPTVGDLVFYWFEGQRYVGIIISKEQMLYVSDVKVCNISYSKDNHYNDFMEEIEYRSLLEQIN